ncbi:MAG TPA: TadE family protein [Solirubrobacteraceae bacterium]
MSSPRGAHREVAGQALTEFALVVPILLILFMGILDFGRAVYAYNAVSNAAREGARTAIVNQNATDIRTRAAAQATALGIDTTSTSCPPSGTSGVCVQFMTPDLSASCTTVDIGCVSVVTVKYTFTAITPIIGNLVGSIPMSSTSKEPVESACTGNGCPIP